MYYPSSQIVTGSYTNGGELTLEGSPTNYTGYYYQTSDGRYFSNKNPNDKPTNELFPVNKRSNSTSSMFEQPITRNNNYYLIKGIYSVLPYPENYAPSPPKQIIPLPTEEDYQLGEFKRYFAYKFSSYETTEIDQTQYNQFQAKDPSVQTDLFTSTEIMWLLKGNREKVNKTNSNLVKINEKNNNLPYFSKYFQDRYDKYFQYGSNENIYSDGKEIKSKKTGKPYVGYYHIHPTKGPMVGRQHTMEAHDYLEFTPTGSILNPLTPTIQSGSYNEPTKTITNTFGGY
jgi:hypothetical protein